MCECVCVCVCVCVFVCVCVGSNQELWQSDKPSLKSMNQLLNYTSLKPRAYTNNRRERARKKRKRLKLWVCLKQAQTHTETVTHRPLMGMFCISMTDKCQWFNQVIRHYASWCVHLLTTAPEGRWIKVYSQHRCRSTDSRLRGVSFWSARTCG